MADFVYNVAKRGFLDGTVDWDAPGAAVVRCLLLEAASDENPDDDTIADVLGRAGTTELTSTGYSRQALTTLAPTADDADDEGVADANDVTFPSVSQAGAEQVVAFVVYYDPDGTDTDSQNIPITFVDSAAEFPLTPNGSDIQIVWNAEGVINLT